MNISSKSCLSIFLDIYLEEGLPDHMVVLVSVFKGTFILISTVGAPFYILTEGTQGFQFLHILTNTYFIFVLGFFFLIVAILVGMRWYLIVGLI